jgi:hypothetical protein
MRILLCLFVKYLYFLSFPCTSTIHIPSVNLGGVVTPISEKSGVASSERVLVPARGAWELDNGQKSAIALGRCRWVCGRCGFTCISVSPTIDCCRTAGFRGYTGASVAGRCSFFVFCQSQRPCVAVGASISPCLIGYEWE